jgi:hypothetical protein
MKASLKRKKNQNPRKTPSALFARCIHTVMNNLNANRISIVFQEQLPCQKDRALRESGTEQVVCLR